MEETRKNTIVKTIPVIDMRATGENIQRLRDEAGLSARDLACEVGVTFQAVYRWERGIVIPSIDNLAILAAVLGCGLDDIVATSFTPFTAAPRRGRTDARRG